MNKLATIGPCPIDLVPITHFSRFPKGTSLADAWLICGPSAERNLALAPIWKVIASAYLEGLSHGAAIMKEPSMV